MITLLLLPGQDEEIYNLMEEESSLQEVGTLLFILVTDLSSTDRE